VNFNFRNKEIGNYSDQSVSTPVSLGHVCQEDYRVIDIICCNGFSVIVELPKSSKMNFHGYKTIVETETMNKNLEGIFTEEI
jgi:hypothetical protein